MPTYEYACTACGHAWEQVQRITEPPIELCPSCKQSAAHRLISGGTNFILKGGGWYSDLYASSKPAEKKSDDGSKAASGSDAPAKPAAPDASSGSGSGSGSGEGAKPSGTGTSGASPSSPSSSTPASSTPQKSSAAPAST